jgi:putative transposase
MSNYRRIFVPGGHYFFTVVTYQRRPLFEASENVTLLRTAFKTIITKQPFTIDAIVVLPEHLHCIWQLPEGDANYSGRWREIKKHLSKRIGSKRNRRGEFDVWQRRSWEHLLRDEDDWRRHMDYIHYNPVKHGLAASPGQWPYSSFRKAVAAGWYEPDWGKQQEPENIRDMDCE